MKLSRGKCTEYYEGEVQCSSGNFVRRTFPISLGEKTFSPKTLLCLKERSEQRTELGRTRGPCWVNNEIKNRVRGTSSNVAVMLCAIPLHVSLVSALGGPMWFGHRKQTENC